MLTPEGVLKIPINVFALFVLPLTKSYFIITSQADFILKMTRCILLSTITVYIIQKNYKELYSFPWHVTETTLVLNDTGLFVCLFLFFFILSTVLEWGKLLFHLNELHNILQFSEE